MNDSNIERELESLIGLSAGHICYGDIEESSLLHKAVLDAASLMWGSLKSAWILESVEINGTTSWISPDKKMIANVTVEGKINIGQYEADE
jgi:hypothetical protein